MYTLYILRCKDDSFYTGIAKNLDKRLEMHRAGTGSKYVRARLPIEVVYTEEWKDRSSATKREMEIKKMTRTDKLKLIQ
jgi:putative endonuclease